MRAFFPASCICIYIRSNGPARDQAKILWRKSCANLKRKERLTRLHYVINFIQSSGVSFCVSCVNLNEGIGERKTLFMCLALSVTRPFEFVIFHSLLVFVSLPIIHCSRRALTLGFEIELTSCLHAAARRLSDWRLIIMWIGKRSAEKKVSNLGDVHACENMQHMANVVDVFTLI